MGAGADAPDTDADALALTIRYSIAVDGPPRFRRQALGWLATGAALGGVTADQVVVQCTNAVPDAFRRTVARAFGVEVTALPGGGDTRGTLNKLSQLAHPALDGDWIVLCDCDTAFAEPLPATAFRSGIAAKLVDVGFPDLEFWTDLLGRLGLSNGQPEARRAAKGGGVTYRNNCNGGLYVGDSGHWARIAPEWRRAADALPTWMAAPPSWTRYYDQIAFGVACARLGLDVELLPPRLNFPFQENPPAPLEIQPVLLHHHQSLESGRLHCRPGHAACPGVLTAVRRVNRVLDRLDWKAFGL
jgi:hypothetical protein